MRLPRFNPPPPAWAAIHWLLYAAGAVAFLWPLTAHPTERMPDTIWFHDASFVMYAARTSVRNLVTPGAYRFDSLALYPLPHALLTSEHLLLLGSLLAPLERLTTAAGAYNAVLVMLLATGGWAMDRLCRRIGVPRTLSAVAGVLFAFSPIHLFHLARLQLLGIACFPLAWHAALSWRERPTRRGALLVGLALALPALYNLYYAVFTVLTTAILIVGHEAGRPARRLATDHARTLWAALPPLGVAALYDAPYAFRSATTALGPRSHPSLTGWVGRTGDFLRADPLSRLWGTELPRTSRDDGSTSFPGSLAVAFLCAGFLAPDLRPPWRWAGALIGARVSLLAAGLAIAPATGSWWSLAAVWAGGALAVAAARRRLGRPPVGPLYYGFAATVGACFLMFHGPAMRLGDLAPITTTPWTTLTHLLPGLGSARALRRFNIPLLAAGLAVGALALARLGDRLGRRRRWAALALLALAPLDVWSRPIPIRPRVDLCREPLWQALASRSDGRPLFVFPFLPDADGTTMMDATHCHGHPVLNGHTSVKPPRMTEIEDLAAAAGRPDRCRALFDRLRADGVGWVAVDHRAYAAPPDGALACAQANGAVAVFADPCGVLLSLSPDAGRAVDLSGFAPDHARCRRGPLGR